MFNLTRLPLLGTAALAALTLTGCPNVYSDEFMRSLDQSYYSKWPQEISPDALPAHSLGQDIMPFFREHAGACGMFANLNLPLPANRNYIPEEIQRFTGTPLNTPVVSIRRVVGENIFYYVFPGLDQTKPATDLGFENLFNVGDRGLTGTFGLSRDYPVVPSAGDSWRIRQSCSGFLNSHLASSFEGIGAPPFIPYGAFKAAVQNDKEMKSSIVAVSGKFFSPLLGLLSEDDISPDSVNVKLNLWYKYRSEAAQGNLAGFIDKSRLLREFRGLLISRATDTGSINELNANGVLTMDMNQIGKIEGKLDAKYSVKNTFNSIVYNTLIYCQTGGCDFKSMSLPVPESIATSFAKVSPDGGKDVFSSIQPNRTLRFWQDVAGIPDKYCQKGESRWDINFIKNGDVFSPSSKPVLTTSPLPMDKDGIQRCRYSIEGKVRSDLSAAKLNSDNESVELGFELVNKDTLNYNGKAFQIKIPGRVMFSSKNAIQPIIVGKEPLSYEKVGNDPRSMSLRWEFDVIFREDQADLSQIIDYARNNLAAGSKARLSHFNQNRLERVTDDIIEVKARPDQDERKFYHVTVTSRKKFDFSNPNLFSDDQYTLNTDLQVPLRNRELQSVPLEVKLNYPVPLPTATPVPVSTPAPINSDTPTPSE